MASSFIKNTSKLLAGNLFAQVLGIIAIPIITRLYSVEAYGVFSVILASTAILASISSASIYLAILIPKLERDAKNIAKLSIIFTIVFSLVLMLILVLNENRIKEYFNINFYVLITIPLLVVLQSVYTTMTYWGVRQEYFGKVSKSKLTESLVDRVSSISLGFLGQTSTYSLIFSRALAGFSAILQLLNLWSNSKKAKSSTAIYFSLIRKYKNYILFNTPSMLLISCVMQLPVILIAMFFSPEAAGLYAIANRVVNIPVSALGSAISKTFMKRIADDYRNDNFVKIGIEGVEFYRLLFSLLLVPFSLLIVTSEQIFKLVLSNDWAGAGEIAQLLAYLAMSTLLTQSFGGIFDVYQKQKSRLYFHIVNLIVRVSAITLGFYSGLGFVSTMFVYCVLSTLMNFIALDLMFRYLGHAKAVLMNLLSNAKYVGLYLISMLLVTINVTSESVVLIYSLVLAVLWLFQIKGIKNLINAVQD